METTSRKMKSVLGFAFVMVLLIAMFAIPATKRTAYAAGDSGKTVNVVFVVDESGSMENNDAQKLRYKAINLFLQHTMDSGNNVGFVRFSDKIENYDIRELNGINAKSNFADLVSNGTTAGGTDIGGAIDTATEMLVKDGDSSLESVIILLTDGKTDLAGNSKEKDANGKIKSNMTVSEERKAEAIDRAQSNGIKIYSVCLNTGTSAAAVEEVKAISDATGGSWIEVKNPNDFQKAFLNMLGEILDIEIPDFDEHTIDSSGVYEETFMIPIGVNEVNITINTENDITVELYDPDGNKVDLSNSILITDWYQFVKLLKPDCGEWTLKVIGDPGTKIELSLIYDNDVKISLYDNSTGTVVYNQPVEVEVAVTNCGNPVTDPAVFKRIPVILEVVNTTAGTTEDITIPDGKLKYDLIFTESGKYEVTAMIDDGRYVLCSETLSFELTNVGPSAQDFTIERSVFPWTAAEVIDLSQYVSDPEGLPVTIELKSSDLVAGTYSISGDELTVEISKCKNGTVSFTATDNEGETVTFTGTFEIKNLMTIIIIVVACIIALVIIILVVKNIKYKGAPIKGKIKIVAYGGKDGTTRPQVYEGGKGDVKMSFAFNLSGQGGLIDAHCAFHAGSNDSFIYFLCSDGCYSDEKPNEKQKKIKLLDGMETIVYGQENGKEKLKITYKSYKSEMGF